MIGTRIVNLFGLINQKITPLRISKYALKPIKDTVIKAVTSLEAITLAVAVFYQFSFKEGLKSSTSLVDIFLSTYAHLTNAQSDRGVVAVSTNLLDIYIGVLIKLYASSGDSVIAASQSVLDIWIDGSKVKGRENIEPSIEASTSLNGILIGHRDSYV